MGKRPKKKKGGQKGSQQRAQGQENSTSSAGKRGKLDSDQLSLYRIYKYSTEAVIEWGKSTFNKKKKTKPAAGKLMSLSRLIFDILGSLADDGVLMPDLVLEDLDVAISYRQKVQGIYQAMPQVSKEDFQRHQWVINQLQVLQKRFLANKEQRHQQKTPQNTKRTKASSSLDYDEKSVRKGFDALALSDDEESVSESDADPPGAEESEEKAAVAAAVAVAVAAAAPPPPPPPPIISPTQEELEAEERQFAVALFLYEVDSIRENLRGRWRNWAKDQAENPGQDDTEKARKLLGVTAATEYSLSAVRKLLLQMSLEIDSFADFDMLIQSTDNTSQSTAQQHTKEDFQEGNLVTIVGLEKRPDLNGRQGFISSDSVDTKASGRLPVELFPLATKKTLSVLPKNLTFADNTFSRLCEIHSAVKSITWAELKVPKQPKKIYGSPISASVQEAGIALIMKGDEFERAAMNQDFQTLLKLVIQYSLPIWMSMSQYLPDAGAADGVFNAYLRDFSTSQSPNVSFIFALLVVLDSGIACAREKMAMGEETKDMFVKTINNVYDAQVYTSGIELLEKDGLKSVALYSHFEFSRHMSQEYSLAGMFFPFISGELLFMGLKMHFVCGSGLVYAYVEKYVHILHIYWILRQEGLLGKIPELESIVGLYQQRVFFRGGLPKKGQEAFLKCQQLAQGVSVEAIRLLDGKTVAKRTGRAKLNPDALTYEGLHVSEMSRLLDVLQWKSMPFVDKAKCLDEVESIAQNDLAIFLAPLIQVSVKVMELVRILETRMIQYARESGPQMMPNFAFHTSQMTPLDLVSFWTMMLGDDWSLIPGEKEKMLRVLALLYSQVFRDGTEAVVPDEEPCLIFSSNDHTVDSYLWGQKGSRRMENRHV